MKNLSIAVLITILCSCTVTKQDKNERVELPPLPTTCDDTAIEIAQELDDVSLKTLQSIKRDELSQFHFSWGMWIRNSFMLWSKNSPIRKSCAMEYESEDMHPDVASGIIMQKVWDIVHRAT